MRIVTDSRPMEAPADPDKDTIFQLYKLVATPEELATMDALYRRGGFGYGEVKKALADSADRYFAEARQRRAELEQDPDRVSQILREGAAKARVTATTVLNRVKAACGLNSIGQG